MMKKIFYFFHGMVIGCLQRSYTGTQNLRHLFVFHFLEIFQVEDDALLLGQLQDGLLEELLRFVAVEVRVTLQFVGQGRVGIVDRRFSARCLFRKFRHSLRAMR